MKTSKITIDNIKNLKIDDKLLCVKAYDDFSASYGNVRKNTWLSLGSTFTFSSAKYNTISAEALCINIIEINYMYFPADCFEIIENDVMLEKLIIHNRLDMIE